MEKRKYAEYFQSYTEYLILVLHLFNAKRVR